MLDPQEDKKFNLIARLCSDSDYRTSLFAREDSQILLQKMELRDFPIKNLLSCPSFDLPKALLGYEYQYAKVMGKRDKRSISISGENQRIFISKLLSSQDNLGSTLTIVSGITDFQKARFLSFLLVFCKLLSKSKEVSQQKPLWHYVKGGFDDIIRDVEEVRSQKGSINHLVLDGLSLNSSKLKMEKFNDLLALYQNSRANTNIIIIGAGFDPLKIAAECLNTTFHAGIYLDEGLVVSL